MSRKVSYNINRFDGGMTDSIRDTSDTSKCALVSHFDIYRDTHQIHVMPGILSSNTFDGTADAVKTYDLRAYGQLGSGEYYALGTKSDGTGSKILWWDDDNSEWSLVPSGFTSTWGVEGTATLPKHPFFYFNGAAEWNYPVQSGGSTYVAEHGPNATDGSYDATWQLLHSVTSTERYNLEKGFDSEIYIAHPNLGGIKKMTQSAVTTAKTTGGSTYDVHSGDYTIGIVQSLSRPIRGTMLLWDSASTLADQNVRLRNGGTRVLGNPSGIWTAVLDEGILSSSGIESDSNGVASISVITVLGETPVTAYRLYGFPAANTANDLFTLRNSYRDAMLWYSRLAQDSGATTFTEGVMAYGRAYASSPLALSILLDTSSLGIIEQASIFGFQAFFSHGFDGSVSRLDRFDTGTYDIPAKYESLMFGADSPYLKDFNGLSVTTEDLPASSSIKVEYRFDEDDSWTELGTSSTAGQRVHTFTRASGVPIGKFQEIQFRVTATGKIILKNIQFSLTELDSLPYN